MTHFKEAIELQINENLQANEELKKQADPVWTELLQISKRSYEQFSKIQYRR